MKKVVVEKPRSGMRYKSPKGYENSIDKLMEREEEPRGEKIYQKWESYSDGKRLTDVLGPLRGYLKKNVGRAWDDIYSEICQNLPANNTNASHVRDHITKMVETTVFMKDGSPYTSIGEKLEYIGSFLCSFYVNPETGILCELKNNRKKRYYNKNKKICIDAGPNQVYLKIGGIWYLLYLAVDTGVTKTYLNVFGTTTNYISYSKFDFAFTRTLSDSERIKYYGNATFYCCRKKQLNSREIKKAGLR
jgi:hypothetical protein